MNAGDKVGLGPHCWGCLQSDCDACSSGREPYCSEKRETYNDRLAVFSCFLRICNLHSLVVVWADESTLQVSR